MQRIFSGVQPTGNLHLGNYLGAIRNWVRLQDSYDCVFCVVDLHALTVWQTPIELRTNTRNVAAALVAAGIDVKKHIIFNQSQVSGHAELAWIFNCVARLGWLNRMTQFKEKAGKNRENASVGLYAYPNLMAADILLYKGTHVPVGEDQKQHLELARDIAQKFNNDFCVDFFPVVEPLILGAATRVMSLRDGTSKMSKSDPSSLSRIDLIDSAETISKKIRKAKTDSGSFPATPEEFIDRPEAVNLIGIYAALADLEIKEVCGQFDGKEFSVFKEKLADLVISELEPFQKKFFDLLNDPKNLDEIISDGAERARAISEPILKEVHEIVGFFCSES